MNHKLLYFIIALGLFACNGSRQLVSPEAIIKDTTIEQRQLDTVFVQAPPIEEPAATVLPVYNPSYPRNIDLIHTKLDLSFDWEKEAVIGKAELTISALFYPVEYFELDAKDFEIQAVFNKITTANLDYQYNGEKIEVNLPEALTSEDSVIIVIDYIAYPKAGPDGSAAISSDQGLFFINAQNTSNKPQQIWTQGETEFNSRWFPTVDKPNERSTQETILTVQNKFKTLSNGVLVRSEELEGGYRKDYWLMDDPHAPYLFMVAVGDFAVVKERWEDIEVLYYVEPPYEQDAQAIFSHTPEMLSFFSEKLNYKYPWDKYAQIIVRDYVSGAMENTTSVIFGDFIQKHKRELIDDGNDYIVAHELFHHWFGDLVTCESWANLTLNEGFANYSEYLWFEHKYGKDRADDHRQDELDGYFAEANQNPKKLIRFDYDDKENMFDAHSYNKGGLVLHMLRNIVGDDAFFAALNYYLTKHAYTAVEVHDLRLAFEDITGIDLNWFFNQWYLHAGHPDLSVSSIWNEETKSAEVTIEQMQSGDEIPDIFILPTTLDFFYADGRIEREEIIIDSRKDFFNFNLPEAPSMILLDGSDILLAEISQDFTPQQLSLLYQADLSYEGRRQAIESLAPEEYPDIFAQALDDPYWLIRNTAINKIDWENQNLSRLRELARTDEDSRVKMSSINILGHLKDTLSQSLFVENINNQEAYNVIASSLVAIYQLNKQEGLQKAKVLEQSESSDILSAISEIYAEAKDSTTLAFFAETMNRVKGLPSFIYFNSLATVYAGASPDQQDSIIEQVVKIAKGEVGDIYSQLSAFRQMSALLQPLEDRDKEKVTMIKSTLKNIAETEGNPQLRYILLSYL